MKTLHGIALLVALKVGALMGYQLSSWSLKRTRAELADFKSAAKQAELEHEAMRQRLEQKLGRLKDEHASQVAQLQQASQSDKLALQRSLATTPERIAAAEAGLQQVAESLDDTRKARETAVGALKVELQEKELELQHLQAQLEKERAGLACLSMAVPRDEIRILNSTYSGDERLQP